MDADGANAREIPYARHDFPQYRCRIQLMMANPSSCAGLRRSLAGIPVPYRTIPHGWAFRPNGICERFHRTVLDEFYRVAFRKKIYTSIEALQADLDIWVQQYNEVRSHQGRWCYGKTPMQTFLDSLPLAKEKLMAA